MKRPNAASLLVLLASGALLLATSPRLRSGTVTIDRGFLAPLATVLQDRGAPGADHQASELFWPNFDKLVYLARSNDPVAIQVVQRLMLRESLPESCGCISGCLPNAVFADGEAPSGFLDQLPLLSCNEQARILQRLDYILQDSPDAGYEGWIEIRAVYLAKHSGVAAFYERPDFETQPSPPETTTATAAEALPQT